MNLLIKVNRLLDKVSEVHDVEYLYINYVKVKLAISKQFGSHYFKS